MTITFIREKECELNYFVYANFNGQAVCFCNWYVLTGPPAAVYPFTGLPPTFFAQLTAAGILFCPSEAAKIKRIIDGYPVTSWTVV